jgi:hypothetical protein
VRWIVFVRFEEGQRGGRISQLRQQHEGDWFVGKAVGERPSRNDANQFHLYEQ